MNLWDGLLADNPVAPAFVRYWTKADKVGFWPAMVCPLMTHNGQNKQDVKIKAVGNDDKRHCRAA